MKEAFIALGSNLGDPLQQVQNAINALGSLPNTQLINVSPWYRSKAIGPGQQYDYINGVAAIATRLSAEQLLNQLQTIEDIHHRVRTEHWGPRTLDLDILLYGNDAINSERLSIPHPHMLERNFVMFPLYDIAPTLVLHNHQPIHEYIKSCSRQDLYLVDENSSSTMATPST